MRRKLVMCLLLTLSSLLTLPLTAQSSTRSAPPSRTDSAEEYGIDLTASYSGEQVWELVQIIFEESDSSIEEAYSRGYRQGALCAEEWRGKYEQARHRQLTFGAGGTIAGTIVGCGLGFAAYSALQGFR